MVRKTVDPEMDLKVVGAKHTAIQDEKLSAKMPQVGKMPTGKEAVKKITPGMG